MNALAALAIGGGVFVTLVCLFISGCYVAREVRGIVNSEDDWKAAGQVVFCSFIGMMWVITWMIVRWLS